MKRLLKGASVFRRMEDEALTNGKNNAQVPLWTKTFVLIIMVNLLMFTSMYVLLPTLPVYAQEIGGSETMAGLIVTLFTFAAVVVRPFSGNLLDRRGRKTVLLVGIGIFLLSAVAYNWAYVVWLLLALRMVHGVGWGVTTTASGTVAADIIPAPRRGEGMGYYGISAVIAMAIGPYLGLFVIGKYSFTALFGLSIAFAAAGLLAAMLINYEQKATGAPKKAEKGVIIEITAIPPALVLFFVALTYGGIVSFLQSYAGYRGIENIGPFFSVYAIVLLLSRPVMGKLADKSGADPVLIPGILLVAAALLSSARLTPCPSSC